MCKKTEELEKFLESNLTKVLKKETKETLGDRNTYIGASDIGGCPFNVVMAKRNPPEHSMKQQIIFQRGHLAESIVKKMFTGLNIVEQHEVVGQIGEVPIKAHIDMLVKSKTRCVVIEIKTVSAPVSVPYESWVLQVQLQMGLMMEECDHEIEAYVIAMDLNTGWLKAFRIEFNDVLFNTCLNKAEHLEDAMLGRCEPKAIIQYYCGTCPFKMQCPKRGEFGTDLPSEVAADLKFIKEAALMKKEADRRKARVKNYMVNMNIKVGRDIENQAVCSVQETNYSGFDTEALKINYPKIYKELSTTSSSHKLTVL